MHWIDPVHQASSASCEPARPNGVRAECGTSTCGRRGDCQEIPRDSRRAGAYEEPGARKVDSGDNQMPFVSAKRYRDGDDIYD